MRLSSPLQSLAGQRNRMLPTALFFSLSRLLPSGVHVVCNVRAKSGDKALNRSQHDDRQNLLSANRALLALFKGRIRQLLRLQFLH